MFNITPCFIIMQDKKDITLALDLTGSTLPDNDIAGALNFAHTLYPSLKVHVFGSESLKEAMQRGKIDDKFYVFHHAQAADTTKSPQQSASDVSCATALALLMTLNKESMATVSMSDGTYLSAMSRHIVGAYSETLSLASKIPTGAKSYLLMLDMGANVAVGADDLLKFAILGSACARVYLDKEAPRVRLLNALGDDVRLNPMAYDANIYLKKDSSIRYDGFIAPDKIFLTDANVIVSDANTANTALKAAKGIADAYDSGSSMSRFLSKMMRPDWLTPWQYNASVILGLKENVIACHARQGKDALALAVVEAVLACEHNLAQSMYNNLTSDKQI